MDWLFLIDDTENILVNILHEINYHFLFHGICVFTIAPNFCNDVTCGGGLLVNSDHNRGGGEIAKLVRARSR